MTDPQDTLTQWEEIIKKSTKAVLWYPHTYDGTIRGPFNRWFRCERGDDQSDKYPPNKGLISSIECDVEFAALAMNNFQKLIDTVRKKDGALEISKCYCTGTFALDGIEKCYRCLALTLTKGLK